MSMRRPTFLLAALFFLAAHAAFATEPTAPQLVAKAFDNFRGETSEAKVTMVIHRPDWERSMTLRSWTQGKADALFFIEKPARDAGNGTLKKGRDMWMYNPRINRVVKLPPSMMGQSWMGSDFSNNDLSRSDSILDDYTHALASQETRDGHQFYTIISTPHEEAPVVWGHQELVVRDDGIMMRQAFFDEDGLLVKAMTTLEVKSLGGRLVPAVLSMVKAGEEGEGQWTRVVYEEITFNAPIKPGFFSLSNLNRLRR